MEGDRILSELESVENALTEREFSSEFSSVELRVIKNDLLLLLLLLLLFGSTLSSAGN